MSKLTELTEKAALEGDELIYVVDDPSGTPVDRKAVLQVPVSKITTGAALEGQVLEADGAGGAQVSEVLEYLAVVSQSGANAPTATVITNTLGGVPVWTRHAEGSYYATLAGAFPAGRTVFMAKMVQSSFELDAAATAARLSNDIVGITQTNSSSDPVDGLYNVTFWVRVYPA